MNNLDLCNPTHILFGKGRIADLGAQAPAQAKLLLVYGGGSAERTDVLAQVRAALGPREPVEFGGIEPNPRFATPLTPDTARRILQAAL